MAADRPPRRIALIAVLLAAPVLLWPWMLRSDYVGADDTLRLLLRLFPLYAIGTAYLYWRCYAERPWLSRCLAAILLLSYAALLLPGA